MKDSKLLKFFNTHPRNRIRLVIFPYAGGNAANYGSWEPFLAPEIEICAVQLPGRGDRHDEEPYHHFSAVIQELGESLQDMVNMPYVLFGHSMGALLCYEFCSFLADNDFPLPLHVFLSGATPPRRIPGDHLIHKLNDEELVKRLTDLNSIPRVILENPNLLRFFLPAFKADFAMIESYHYRNTYRFSMPVTVFGGQEDTIAPLERLPDWESFTKAFCRVAVFPGDHFFIFSEKDRLLAEINRELRYLSIVE